MPDIEIPKRAKGSRMAKGRPFTTEEYERMLMATWKVVTQAESRGDDATKLSEHETAVVESWKQLITGLWLSGLRLGEALILSWAENAKVSVLMGGKYPAIRFQAEGQKAHRDEILPLSPEFAEFLETIPTDQ